MLADYGLDWTIDWLPAGTTVDPAMSAFDVFVCGLRPGPIGGPELLARVAALYPQAVRILLLDQNPDEASVDIAQGLDGAHRVLARPLDAAELVAAVESVVDLRELLDNEALKRVLGRINSLPPPPRLYLQLTRLLRDPDASNAAIAQTLSQDPAIAAKVLRLCNSAYFSGGREITDMRGAVTRLGHQTLLRMVLTIEAFGGPKLASSQEREAMQDRALRASNLARRLLPGPSAELAATASLLAEVGRLLPGVSSGEPGEEGPHYAEAGAYLMGLWGLPMPIVEAVAYQHRPGHLRAAGFWVAGAVHVATALVAGREPDEAYLRSVGMLERLPQWREWVQPTVVAEDEA
ncbi:HDOD domain-containing protein [Thermomonas haemolytica]|uniref:HDOD domain-containing protein n=1 Tax=Thermomonas haemolytica TaxID=141949 RepID=UPI0013B3B2B1|nr:HDOD domain-containing protein [Thermomonas haemolytica]